MFFTLKYEFCAIECVINIYNLVRIYLILLLKSLRDQSESPSARSGSAVPAQIVNHIVLTFQSFSQY